MEAYRNAKIRPPKFARLTPSSVGAVLQALEQPRRLVGDILDRPMIYGTTPSLLVQVELREALGHEAAGYA